MQHQARKQREAEVAQARMSWDAQAVFWEKLIWRTMITTHPQSTQRHPTKTIRTNILFATPEYIFKTKC
eukprot:2484313-Amphidinium_carterae.1